MLFRLAISCSIILNDMTNTNVFSSNKLKNKLMLTFLLDCPLKRYVDGLQILKFEAEKYVLSYVLKSDLMLGWKNLCFAILMIPFFMSQKV